MDIGIGLPSTIPGANRDQNLAWARRADERGFSTLGVIDRIVYANLDPLIALAAAAGATERIRLTSSIVIGPYRNTALLAKQATSVDVLSGGRLTVGIAPGGRPDDFEVAGVDFRARGRLFEDQLAELKRIWSGDEIGPAAEREGGPELIVGGYVDAAFRRAAQYGDGWIAGGRPPDDVARGAEAVRQAWEAAGRAGKPRFLGLAYFALGAHAEAAAAGYLKHYYAWLGDMAEAIAASAATDPETVKQYADAYAAAGLDELILFPCSPEPDQVDLLADVVL
jgi:alkanesulfonate monooxygenase SsuD/methylene tetrahydromethanopterin reductase-like flavin-dependent oxidoreductase (luciferase family)